MKNLLIVKIAIISALLTQIGHAAYVFNKLSHDQNTIWDIISSYIFAFSLELSIYIFTVSGKRKVASFFAFISILINILYYWYMIKFDFNFVGSLIISFIIPVTIWFYSDLISEDEVKKILKTNKKPVKKLKEDE